MKRNSILALGLSVALLAMPAFGQHVHQLYYNNSNWTDINLTSLVNGPQPAMVGITSFYTTPNYDLHVFYVSNSDSHIHQLAYKQFCFFVCSSIWWPDEDVTAETGGVTAVTNTFSAPMSGFALGNAQYVYFCGSDNAVHEYSYGDHGNWRWVDSNLNALARAGSSANCSDLSNALVAYSTPNGERHIFYQPYSGANHIYQFTHVVCAPIQCFPSWYVEDDTNRTHGVKGDGTSMAGFAIGNAQYVFFESPTGSIHEYSYGKGGNWNWVDTNVTAAAKGVPSDKNLYVGVAAFHIPGTSQMEVYYAASGFDTHQMTFENNKWTDTDIGGDGPDYQSQIVGFATTPNDQFHVYYASEPGFPGIYQKYYNGSWSFEQLSSGLTEGGLTGFAINNFQYVYYISFN